MNLSIPNINSIFSRKNFTLKNFSYFVLIVMLTQYIPIESRAGVSPIKVGVMAIMPLVLLPYIKITKALLIAFVYAAWIFFTAKLLHPVNFRASTVIYSFMFLTTYVAFFNFVYVQKVFTLDSFLKFVKGMIYVLTIILIIQQICIIIGIKQLPIINLVQILNRGIGANSLTYEPSTFAKVLCLLYYAYLKCYEYKDGNKLSVISVFTETHRPITLLFLWAMFTMGSGTAYICLAVLSLYFMKGFQFIYAIPIFIGLYLVMSSLQFQMFEKANSAVIATMSGDIEEVRRVNHSASIRIVPMLNTLSLDFTDTKTWIGEGCDSNRNRQLSANKYLDVINDYGFIAYLLSLLLVFGCAIKPLSIPTIMFFMGIGGGTNNFPFAWGILMLLTCIRYFSDNYKTEYINIK